MSPRNQALPPRATALLLALCAALLAFRLGDVPLLGPDESRYARVAVEMHRSGDWVTPTLQGRPWLEKPALYYWLAALAYAGLGVNEAAARLPSVLAAVSLVGLTALLGARLLGATAGLHAGFVMATSLLPFAYGRAAAMDMLLAATVTLAIGLLALRVLGVAGPLALPAAGAAMGLAVLAKGPLGLVLPGLVVAGWLLATRDGRLLRALAAPRCVLAFLAVAAPWYLLVWRAQGQAFVEVFLLDHNLARFTSTVHRHPGPFFYYVPVVLAGLFPWSGVAIPAVAALSPRRGRVDLFLLLWLALPFGFFSAAGSKLPGYVLPCLPPLALLMGRTAERLTRADAVRSPMPRVIALVGVALGALAAAAPLALRFQGEPRWSGLLPPCLWALVVAFGVSRALDRAPWGAPALLRVGGAGFLLLIGASAPPLLAARESGRDLFLPARGREVLAWGAWRTAWMAGYFYNDGRVREVAGLPEIQEALRKGPVLVLCGPGERRRLERMPGLSVLVLAEGARRNALLRLLATPDLPMAHVASASAFDLPS